MPGRIDDVWHIAIQVLPATYYGRVSYSEKQGSSAFAGLESGGGLKTRIVKWVLVLAVIALNGCAAMVAEVLVVPATVILVGAVVGVVGDKITSHFLKASSKSFFNKRLTCCAFL